MLTLAELKAEALNMYADIDINWDSAKPVNRGTIQMLRGNSMMLEAIYTALLNGESVVGEGPSSLTYEDREKYVNELADALVESYWLSEVAARLTAVQNLLTVK